MLKKLLSPFTAYIVAGAIAAGFGLNLYINYKDSQIHKLQAQHEIDQTKIETREVLVGINSKLSALSESVAKSDRRVDAVLDTKTKAIKEAPNASTPVPADVAVAWHDAIVGLRNEAASN